MTAAGLWRWLTGSNQELVMSDDWLSDKERLLEYEAFTLRQGEGMVTADWVEMKRRELWQKATEKQPGEVRQFSKRRA